MNDAALARALADHRAGRLDVAARAYRRILEADPEHADAWHLLALTLHQRGENALAVELVRRALMLAPRVANYHNTLGLALHGQGDRDGALRALQTAVTLDPGDADAHNNLGMVFTDMRRYDDALRALRRSLEIRADNAGAMHNLGRALTGLGDEAGAVAYLRDACDRDPANATYWNSLGVALRQSADFDEALSAFERALEIDAELIDAHVNRAHAWFFEGDFARAWPEHEWRLLRPQFAARMARGCWTGEDAAGRTILLWAEQGLGDAIQFVRYAPLVARRGARVIVACRAPLHRLFAGVEGVDRVVAPADATPCDAHAALMSLPLLLGLARGAGDIPATVPYLTPPPARLPDRAARLRVGLVWAGNPDHSNDRNRSLALGDFAPLAAIPDIAFYALQKGPAADQPAPAGMAVTRLGERFADFADTAAALAGLDLLISVDTAVAHLAGALGRPVWLLVPSIPDWRWGRDAESTPWYPTMRLFRQTPGEAWSAVILRLATALAAL